MHPLVLVFQLLNSSANYAVLRNYELLPQNHGRDIDIIICRNDFKRIRNQIVEIFSSLEYKLFQYYKGSEMHSMAFAETKAPYNLISFDFLFSIYIKDTILLTSQDVLKTKMYNGKIYHVRKDMEYLSKFIYNKILKTPYPDKYKNIEKEAYALYSQEINEVLNKLGIKQDFSLRKIKLHQYKKHFLQMFSAHLRYMVATISNFIHPQGISFSFTGPDGVGKTTVINQIAEILNKLYKSVPVYHFRPMLINNLGEVAHTAGLKKEVDRDYSNPHRGGRTGRFSSFIRLFYYSIDYIVGYQWKVKHQVFQRKIVIFDRYYTDIICDSRRSRIYLNYKFLYGFGKLFIPSLDYNILLTASTDTILARKKELDEEGIRTINEKIDYLADKKGYKKILNEQTPEVAVAEILSYIFENQHKKNLRRLK